MILEPKDLNFVNEAIHSQPKIDALESKIVTRCQKYVPLRQKYVR